MYVCLLYKNFQLRPDILRRTAGIFHGMIEECVELSRELSRPSRDRARFVASRIKIFRCSGSFSGARPSNRALNCLAARWRARCVRAAWQERGRGRCKNATRFTTRTQFRLTRLQRGNEPYYKEEHGCPGVTHLDGRKLDLRG